MSKEYSEEALDIFPGLNAIPWYDLKHAYGSAEEVPMWLRQLTSHDEHVRKQAMSHLWASICHQGWICPATAYAVPHLIRLLQEPAVQGKEEILGLLAAIAVADPELHAEQWRKNSRVPQWNVPEYIPFKNARLEVSRGVPLYVALFEHENKSVCMQAVHVFSRVAQPTAEHRSYLLTAFRREPLSEVRANLVLALGALSHPMPEEWSFFAELVQLHGEDLLAFSSAIILARLAKRETPEEVVQFLAHVMFDRPKALDAYRELPCSGEAAWFAAGWALAHLGSERLQFLVSTLPAMFERANKWESQFLADLLVGMFFTPREAGKKRTQADLTETQWAVLSVLAEQKGIWGFVNFLERLRAYGLPDSRSGLLALLGRELPPVSPPTRPQTDKHRPDRLEIFRDALREKYPHMRIRTMSQTSVSDDITVNDELIFHVPTSPQAIEEMEREHTLLQVLQGRLPLPVPNPLYASEGVREVGRAFMGYPKLPGKSLYKEMFESIDGEETLQTVISQIGSFLSALHHFPLAELNSVALSTKHWREIDEALYARAREVLFPHMEGASHERIIRCFETFLDTAHNFTLTPMLVHNNFGPHALLYDAQTRSISGVVDFTHAGLGDPAHDLAGLFGPKGYGNSFAQRFEAFYPELSSLRDRLQFYVIASFLQETLSRLEQSTEKNFIGSMRFFPV